MTRYADAEIAVAALRTDRVSTAQRLELFRASVTAVSSGLISIQRGGDTTDEDAGYPVIVPGIPGVGDEVVCTNLGGAPVVLGMLGNATTNQPQIGQTYTLADSASGATAATNTSNSTYATVRSATWTSGDIPDGTYQLIVSWDAQFSDSASGSLNMRITANGAVGTVFTLSVGTARERIAFARTFVGSIVAGGLTVTVEYKRDSGSGTASCRNPRIVVLATRTGV